MNTYPVSSVSSFDIGIEIAKLVLTQQSRRAIANWIFATQADFFEADTTHCDSIATNVQLS